MPTSTPLFDPLRFLQEELHATVQLVQGEVRVAFDGPAHPRQRKRAAWCVRQYGRLLVLQLENGGASVQKLMAHGKIRLEGGRYIQS